MLTRPPYELALGIPCGAHPSKAVPFFPLTLGARLLIDVNWASSMESVAHFGDVALGHRLATWCPHGAQLQGYTN